MSAEVQWTEGPSRTYSATAYGCELLVEWSPLRSRWLWGATLGTCCDSIGVSFDTTPESAKRRTIAAALDLATRSGLAAVTQERDALRALAWRVVRAAEARSKAATAAWRSSAMDAHAALTVSAAPAVIEATGRLLGATSALESLLFEGAPPGTDALEEWRPQREGGDGGR